MVIAGLGDLEPHAAQRGIDLRLIGMVFGSAAQREDGDLRLTGSRVRQTAGHVSLGMIQVERSQRVELSELASAVPEVAMNEGERLPRLQKPRREIDGGAQHISGLLDPPLLSQADAEQVVCFCEPSVQGDGVPQQRDSPRYLARALAYERQLVQDAGVCVVKSHVLSVVLDRVVELLERKRDVAESFVRAGGRRIKPRRHREVPHRCGKVAVLLIGFPTFEEDHHRVGSESECAAVSFDGQERLVVP